MFPLPPVYYYKYLISFCPLTGNIALPPQVLCLPRLISSTGTTWLALESNPELVTSFAHKLGLSPDWSFQVPILFIFEGILTFIPYVPGYSWSR